MQSVTKRLGKEAKMTKELIEILQDDREPFLQIVSDFNGMGLVFNRKRLKVGDYVWKDLCIERKEITDFCGSLVDGRIVQQVENMKKYKYRFVIIVGCLKDRKSEVHDHCVLGKIASLIVKHGINVLMCEDEFQFCYLLKCLVDRYKEVEDAKVEI